MLGIHFEEDGMLSVKVHSLLAIAPLSSHSRLKVTDTTAVMSLSMELVS